MRFEKDCPDIRTLDERYLYQYTDNPRLSHELALHSFKVGEALCWLRDAVKRLMRAVHDPDPQIRVKLDDGAFMPIRAHATDAGADVLTPVAFTVGPHDSFVVHTGVHVELPGHTVCMLKSKSGLNVKAGIVSEGVVSEGVVDEGYGGEIVAKLYNHSDVPYRFEVGDKVTQLVILPVLYPSYVQAESISAGDRGDGGFGSTGR